MKTHMYSRRISLLVWASLLLLMHTSPGSLWWPFNTDGNTNTWEDSYANNWRDSDNGSYATNANQLPPAGTARGAVMAPLVRGSHTNVVYVSNQGPKANPISGTLKRYDITTKGEMVIVTLLHTSIKDAQVSADGQWVLFRASVDNRSAFQLIRMDGQGLQTLYCVPVEYNPVLWSGRPIRNTSHFGRSAMSICSMLRLEHTG